MAKDEPRLPLPEPETWSPPKGKHTCGRDPNAGPGTCYHWWDMCPKAEQRGCYQIWLARKMLRENPNDHAAASHLKAHGVTP